MFQFSSLRSHPKVTLPSVDNGWLKNDSIIKDPPKSIHTRRIDKVGSTQMVTDVIEDSGSRICGNIMKFPRGVNPAAEYSAPLSNGVSATSTIRDNSNNPLTLRSDPGYMFRDQYGRGSGGYLARRIMMYGGAFRPPILTQEQLLPLSRQPRIRTSCVTHPEMINYSSRPCDIDMQKIVHDVVLKPPVDPTIYKVIEQNQEQHPTSDYIQNKILTKDISAGIQPRDITLQENLKCFGQTKVDPTTAYAYTQPCSTIPRDTMLYVMEKPGMNYVHDKLLHSDVTPNPHGPLKDGESSVVNKYILEYPRAVRDVVCAPRISSMLPATEIEAKFYLRDNCPAINVVSQPTADLSIAQEPGDISAFVKDDVLNATDIVSIPRLNNLVAKNIIDQNSPHMDKYVHDDMLYAENVSSGQHGSNYVKKSLHDAADYAHIKVAETPLYVPAYSQRARNDYERTDYIHSQHQPGKKVNINQYEQNTNISSCNMDEFTITPRQAKLHPTLSPTHEISNIGTKPLTSDRYQDMNMKSQITSNDLKSRLKRVHFDREPIIVQ